MSTSTAIQALTIGHMQAIVEPDVRDPLQSRQTGYPKLSLSQSKHIRLCLADSRVMEVCEVSDDDFRAFMHRHLDWMRTGTVRDELLCVLDGPMDTYARWWLLLEVTRLAQVNVFVEDVAL